MTASSVKMRRIRRISTMPDHEGKPEAMNTNTMRSTMGLLSSLHSNLQYQRRNWLPKKKAIMAMPPRKTPKGMGKRRKAIAGRFPGAPPRRRAPIHGCRVMRRRVRLIQTASTVQTPNSDPAIDAANMVKMVSLHAQKRAHHRHQLDVAEAHAFDAARAQVDRSCAVDERRADDRSDHRIQQRQASARKRPNSPAAKPGPAEAAKPDR